MKPNLNRGKCPFKWKDSIKCHAYSNGECMNAFVCEPRDGKPKEKLLDKHNQKVNQKSIYPYGLDKKWEFDK